MLVEPHVNLIQNPNAKLIFEREFSFSFIMDVLVSVKTEVNAYGGNEKRQSIYGLKKISTVGRAF